MDLRYFSFKIFILAFLTLSCTDNQAVLVEGNLNYVGSSEIYLEKKPLHYKYSEKIRLDITTDQNGYFSLSTDTDSTQIAFFTIDDQQYPVVLQPGRNLYIRISRVDFPASVDVEGYPEPWDDQFSAYWKAQQTIQDRVDAQMTGFRAGKNTDVIELYRQRIHLARKYLESTPLNVYYYKAVGDYLVKRLENIRYNREENGFEPEKARQEVIEEAKNMNFFSYTSLRAQRAGIRDFTNAYANTFGVEERLEEKYGQELMQYDINRLAYRTLDSAKVSVLRHIDERKALAYAKLHLIAERIGDISARVAQNSYWRFLEDYADFPAYTSFLKSFYLEVETVSPGNPAVPFTLPDPGGKLISMSDFKGKYVLLDFWASWCIPCLDEFPHMRRIYNSYPREKFEIVAISTEEDSLRWRQAIQRFDNPWPQLYGGDGFQQKTFQAYRGGGIPFYILVGPEGRILRYNDVRPSFNLDRVLDSLITN